MRRALSWLIPASAAWLVVFGAVALWVDQLPAPEPEPASTTSPHTQPAPPDPPHPVLWIWTGAIGASLLAVAGLYAWRMGIEPAWNHRLPVAWAAVLGLLLVARGLYGGVWGGPRVWEEASVATAPIWLLIVAVGWATMKRWRMDAWPETGVWGTRAAWLWAIAWCVIAFGVVVTWIDPTAADVWVLTGPLAGLLLFLSLGGWALQVRGDPNP